jgi:hypothetical protein
MFWKISEERRFTTMENTTVQGGSFLIVNRAQILEVCCSACGSRFAASATGEKALVATVGDGGRLFFFCGPCGENIMGRVQNEEARGHYGWDWAVPLRNGTSNGNGTSSGHGA